MKITRKHIAVGGAVLALSAGGVGAAVAAGGGEDASEQVSGPAADKARDAALAEHPGTANAVERDGENGGTWEVEITGKDGKTVDVRLDENYNVTAVEGDGENENENEGESENEGN
ncbi:MAG TPA: PepSY domain-containing protein [Thermoleophilaceae bacterium]|nr:PepSY domain-containing protein [Thermoleophilaceae bacterium]